MFKNIVSPVQAWLLSQGRCVGCGMPLKKDEKLITCKCGRSYIRDLHTGKYRRALLTEV